MILGGVPPHVVMDAVLLSQLVKQEELLILKKSPLSINMNFGCPKLYAHLCEY
jgi:predicted PP-loop superfamily ATPase